MYVDLLALAQAPDLNSISQGMHFITSSPVTTSRELLVQEVKILGEHTEVPSKSTTRSHNHLRGRAVRCSRGSEAGAIHVGDLFQLIFLQHEGSLSSFMSSFQ